VHHFARETASGDDGAVQKIFGMTHRSLPRLCAALCGLSPGAVLAADAIAIVEVRVERATVYTAGVQVLISDDDNRDASIGVRVRALGETEWITAPPLFRVWPETVGISVPEQLAGSIFDLAPGTQYEVELHVVDPDGVDDTQIVMVSTRALPADPATPNTVAVADPATLTAALAVAAPGDVITLAPGVYAGNFAINASGTPQDPIVIRGEDAVNVIIDGGGCTGCNVLEIYGSHVHLENLTIAHAERGLRFQGDGATGNVARRVRFEDVQNGIGSRANQTDFYVCDNDVRGRLTWPWVFEGDASTHWDDRGIDLNGDGHVICHNRIQGFGDPILNLAEGHRAFDVHGNDVLDCFDGIETDRGTGNVRVFRNRWTNVDSAISIQPINGGPLYVLRNELVNVVSEQIKMKMTGGEPSGSIIVHNTFVSGDLALNLQTPITGHNFVVENNLFVGPQTLTGNRTVEWTAGIDGGVFDANGYFPDGGFWFGVVGGNNRLYDSFAAAMASGEVEGDGVLLGAPIFASGVVGPTDEMLAAVAASLELAEGSNAIDAGHVWAGIGDAFEGAGPDLGARERGCQAPSFGPRPVEDEDVVARVNCPTEMPGGTDDGGSDDAGSDDGADDTGGSASASASAGSATAGDDAGGGTVASAGDTGAGSGAGNEGDGGCGCRTTEGKWVAGVPWIAVVLVRRRRRRGAHGVAVADSKASQRRVATYVALRPHARNAVRASRSVHRATPTSCSRPLCPPTTPDAMGSTRGAGDVLPACDRAASCADA